MKEIKDKYKEMIRAIKGNNATALRQILLEGVRLDYKNLNGFNAIHIAVEMGHQNCLRELIDAGADVNVNATNFHRSFPIHMASYSGDIACLKSLIQAGAELNVKDIHGNTPLHWAAFHHKPDCLRYLIECGADIFTRNNDGEIAKDMVDKGMKCFQILQEVEIMMKEKEILNGDQMVGQTSGRGRKAGPLVL